MKKGEVKILAKKVEERIAKGDQIIIKELKSRLKIYLVLPKVTLGIDIL